MSSTVITQPGTLCLGCHQPLAGPYCAACGQPAATRARITLKDLLHDIPHSIWHVDHGVFYTLRELLARPGATLRRYLAGERARFFRPLALLLLVAGVASLLMAVLHLDKVMAEVPARNASAQAQAVARSMTAVNHLILKYFSWFTIAMLPLYAWLSWALLRRLQLYYTEHLLANAFLLSAALLLQIGFMPLQKFTTGGPFFQAIMLCESAALPLYQAWAFNQFANPAYVGGGRVARVLLIAGLGLIINTLFIGGLAWLIVWIMR